MLGFQLLKISNSWLTHHKKTCGNFCITNELCKLAEVQSHPNDKKISVMLPINQSSMRRIPTHPIHEGGQEGAQNE